LSLLKNLEKKLENIIEGAFSAGFPSHVQPVEIAKKIDLELLDNKTVSLSRTFAPNHFIIKLSSEDFDHLKGFADAIKNELSDYVLTRAKENNLYIDDVEIDIVKDEELRLGQFQISSTLTEDVKEELSKESKSQETQIISHDELVQAMSNVEHVLEDPLSKTKYKLIKLETVIGRSKLCDISIADASISRKHAELFKEGDQVRLVDLDSTNGTQVNDTNVQAKMLRNGDKIQIGKSTLIYRRMNG
jgi:hypothetical protein